MLSWIQLLKISGSGRQTDWSEETPGPRAPPEAPHAFRAARDHVPGALQGGEAEHELPPRGAELQATLQLTERSGRPGHGALVCDVSAP